MSGRAGGEGFNVAVVGATGLVGETMITVLEERKFPVKQLFALASERSLGKSVTFRDKRHSVGNLAEFDFSQVDIALFSPGGEVSREYAPKAAAAGCVVIDNTSEFRYLDDVPLVVPEVNPQAIAQYTNRGIIANPNAPPFRCWWCSSPCTMWRSSSTSMWPTYQSVSGAGREAIAELATQSAALPQRPGPGQAGRDTRADRLQLCAADRPLRGQWLHARRDEMVWETRKILGSADIKVNPTAVRVPVFFGHSEAVHITTQPQTGRCCSAENPAEGSGVTVMDERPARGLPHGCGRGSEPRHSLCGTHQG